MDAVVKFYIHPREIPNLSRTWVPVYTDPNIGLVELRIPVKKVEIGTSVTSMCYIKIKRRLTLRMWLKKIFGGRKKNA